MRNLVLFFEGTGQGVSGNATNVTRLRDLCVDDADQRLHLESGPGTRFGAYLSGAIHGADWKAIARDARTWFREAFAPGDSRIFLFGFSRGALIARHVAAELGRRDVEVAYMGLWDTVDATMGLDVAETCPANVQTARHAVARDEARRFFGLVPLTSAASAVARGQVVEQMVFPGSHSDVGGLYDDNHVVADVSLAWIAAGARRCGLRLKAGTRLTQRVDPASAALHSSQELVSNLFGALSPVRRVLKGIRRHALCRRATGYFHAGRPLRT